jgi:hypothetical protein
MLIYRGNADPGITLKITLGFPMIKIKQINPAFPVDIHQPLAGIMRVPVLIDRRDDQITLIL